MSENIQSGLENLDLTRPDTIRSTLDQLLTASRLYTKSSSYKELLNFVVRLRNFAPFNAMILQIQKPGLSYAASELDWKNRFDRTIKEGARPLLILWPFAPVALVYDELDTEGKDLPKDVRFITAQGQVDETKMALLIQLIKNIRIECLYVDAGDNKAGKIDLIKRTNTNKKHSVYRIQINRNHSPAIQFNTLVHELGHLCLGHLGSDRTLNIPERNDINMFQAEFEAESVAYIVSARNGVMLNSEAYLSNFVNEDTAVDKIDVYQVMRAAGQVETLLGLTEHTKSKMPPNGKRNKGKTITLFDKSIN
jgi:hypothetical protein